MLAGLALASALIAAPPVAPSLPFDDKRFALHYSGRAMGRFGASPDGGSPNSFGGGIQIGLGIRLWHGLYFEAGVGETVVQNDEPVTSFRHLGPHPAAAAPAAASVATGSDKAEAVLAGQILLGVRYEVRTARTLRVRPSVFVGATHLHEATLRDFASHPGRTIAGIDPSIRHRTGAQVGFGLNVPFPERWGKNAARFSARFDSDVAYYFDNYAGRVHVGLGIGLQVVFGGARVKG